MEDGAAPKRYPPSSIGHPRSLIFLPTTVRLKLSAAMVITIDGPAGAGKSTVAQALAQRLGFDFLDTGAMYRALGLEALRRNANLEDPRELAYIARHVRIDFDWSKHPPGVILNGDSVG